MGFSGWGVGFQGLGMFRFRISVNSWGAASHLIRRVWVQKKDFKVRVCATQMFKVCKTERAYKSTGIQNPKP